MAEKDCTLLCHLGGWKVGFQERSLLVTSIDSTSLGFWGTAESIIHLAERGESLPVGLMELVALAIRDWVKKLILSSDRSLALGDWRDNAADSGRSEKEPTCPTRMPQAWHLRQRGHRVMGNIGHLQCRSSCSSRKGLKGHPFLTSHIQPILQTGKTGPREAK